jgi:hypothetical protein
MLPSTTEILLKFERGVGEGGVVVCGQGTPFPWPHCLLFAGSFVITIILFHFNFHT